MTIDQCLSCSRYEPIIGATYDILNDVGANLANIEDDMQAGYMNMQDTLDFLRVEKMHKKKDMFKLNYLNTNTKNMNEYKFKDIWDDGVKMNWKLTPVEQQKPQINWRADINSEDKSPAKLDSFQSGPGQTGDDAGSTVQAGEAANAMQQHLDDMNKLLELDKKHEENAKKSNQGSGDSESSEDAEWEKNQNAIAGVKEGFGKMPDDKAKATIENMKQYGYEQAMQNACSASKADPALILSIVAVVSGGDPKSGVLSQDGSSSSDDLQKQFDEGVKKIYSDTKGSTSNPIGMVQACLGGWHDALESLLATGKYNEEWAVGCTEADRWIFPAVTKAYSIVKGACEGNSQASSNINGGNNGAGFPLSTKDLASAYVVQDYGMSSTGNATATVSNGVIIKLPANTELHAPCDGSFSAMAYEDDRLGNHTEITDNSCELTYIFGGLNYMKDIPGDGFQKDNVFGYSTERLVIQVKDKHGYVDPSGVWPKLSDKLSKDKSIGEQIAAENDADIRTS